MTQLTDTIQVQVLTAVRGATVLCRVPTVTVPDGHEQWFRMDQLAREGRLGVNGPDLVTDLAFGYAANALYRRGLLARRTLHSRAYWSATEAGLLALAEWETEQGWSAVAAAQLDVEQARYDVEQATLRSTAAERALEAAYAARTQGSVAS